MIDSKKSVILRDKTNNMHLNDEYIDVKKTRCDRRGVHFENPTGSNVAPEGYVTVEQFRTEAKTSLTKLLNEHGIVSIPIRVVPEGYMTSKEFRKRAFEKVNKFCNKHGIF